MEELIARGEVRLAGGLELWVRRGRVLLMLAAVGAGCAWGLWRLATLPWPTAVAWLAALLLATPVSGLAINLGYHAFFSHQAFATHRWLKLGLGVVGAINLRGPLIEWVAHHRRHHKYTDQPDRDPHTPLQFGRSPWGLARGLAWVFVGEKLSPARTVAAAFAPELLRDPELVRIDRWHDAIVLCWLALPGLVVGLATGDLGQALLATCVLGCMRAALAYVMIAVVVNGLCHLVGARPFAARSRDNARNIAWLTLPTFGGSLHHNHHVFPASLKVSLDGELDPFDLLYWGLVRSGAIWDVQQPAPEQLRDRLGDAATLA